jgi:copper chaperone CopZ
VALEKVEGVERAYVSYELGRAIVVFDSTVTSPERFIAEMERLTGFTAEVSHDGSR